MPEGLLLSSNLRRVYLLFPSGVVVQAIYPDTTTPDPLDSSSLTSEGEVLVSPSHIPSDQEIRRVSSIDVQSNGGYSREKFYTHATDGKGHHSTVRTEVDPSLLGQIGALIASRRIPEYKTSGDFFRDAVFHRAHEIAEKISDDDLLRSVNIAIALDVARAYEIAEQDELELAKRIDRRMYEDRAAYTRDELTSYVSLAQTRRGQSELDSVLKRYFV